MSSEFSFGAGAGAGAGAGPGLGSDFTMLPILVLHNVLSLLGFTRSGPLLSACKYLHNAPVRIQLREEDFRGLNAHLIYKACSSNPATRWNRRLLMPKGPLALDLCPDFFFRDGHFEAVGRLCEEDEDDNGCNAVMEITPQNIMAQALLQLPFPCELSVYRFCDKLPWEDEDGKTPKVLWDSRPSQVGLSDRVFQLWLNGLELPYQDVSLIYWWLRKCGERLVDINLSWWWTISEIHIAHVRNICPNITRWNLCNCMGLDLRVLEGLPNTTTFLDMSRCGMFVFSHSVFGRAGVFEMLETGTPTRTRWLIDFIKRTSIAELYLDEMLIHPEDFTAMHNQLHIPGDTIPDPGGWDKSNFMLYVQQGVTTIGQEDAGPHIHI